MILIKKGEVFITGETAEEMDDIDTMISTLKSETYSSMVKILIIMNGVIDGKIDKSCWNRAAEAVERLSNSSLIASDVIAAWKTADRQLELIKKFGGGKQS